MQCDPIDWDGEGRGKCVLSSGKATLAFSALTHTPSCWIQMRPGLVMPPKLTKF